MRIFKAGGKDWILQIDAPSIIGVRNEHGIDLGKGVECFDRLTAEPVTCQQVIWSLCRKQAEASGISSDTFFGFLADGDVGEQAGRQLFEAIIDFFPSSQREGLRTMLATHFEAMQEAGKMIAERVKAEREGGSIKKKAIDEVRARLDELFGPLTPLASATDLPESSGAKSKAARSAS